MGVRATEVYAATEAPIIACGSPDHPGLSVCDDLVLVEVVDRENRPVPAGTPGHKVLLTNLVNHAQPLIHRLGHAGRGPPPGRTPLAADRRGRRPE
ncbi:MAG TPA: hypothetical protein VE777_10220 [Gaiellales bacterium]|nr:hypothetical protein [Gaiellales bacterium]